MSWPTWLSWSPSPSTEDASERPESDALIERNDALLSQLDAHVSALDSAIGHLLDVVAEQASPEKTRTRP